jgi:ABC-type ATPase involved in cell division
LVVEQPSSDIAKMAVRADLEPGSQQLLVGGIGSGKSTQLLLIARRLSNQPKTIQFYIDVTRETDVSRLNSGAVLASIGLHLLKHLETDSAAAPVLESVSGRIRKFALGETKEVWVPEYESFPPNDDDYAPPDDYYPPIDEDDSERGHYVALKTPGKLRQLSPLFPPLNRDLEEVAEPFGRLVAAARGEGAVLVVILDGLDRMTSPDRFWEVVYQDFRILRTLEVSVLAAAPLSVLFGTSRPISDYVDSVHHLPVVDPKVSRFPMQVLEKRNASELMDARAMEAVSKGSGGVLRDLISLARSAATESYLEGSETITETHVAKAVRELGESYLLGLGERHLGILKQLKSGGGFRVDDPASLELLFTRRVLEYHEPQPRYEVHPALAELLDESEQ